MQSQRFVLRMTAATTADGTRKKQRYQNLIGQKYVCGGRCPSCRKKDGGIRPRPAVFHPALRPNSARYLAAFRARYHATSPFATLLPSDTGTPSISPPFCKRRARCCPWQTFLFRPWFTPSPVYPFHLAFRFPKGSAVPQRCGIKYCQQLIRRIRRCLENVLDMTSKCIPLRDII